MRFCQIYYFVGLLLVSPVYAVPAFETNFDGDEVGMPPQLSFAPAADGVYTKPAFISKVENYDKVVENYHPEVPGRAVLLCGKSSLNFIAKENSITPEGGFRLAFVLLFAEGETERSSTAMRVNFFNQELSHRGFQASVLFVPRGIMIQSGKESKIFDYKWKTGQPLKVGVELSYKEGGVAVSINDDFKQTFPLNAPEPHGIRSFQFTWGSANSQYEAIVTNISAGPIEN